MSSSIAPAVYQKVFETQAQRGFGGKNFLKEPNYEAMRDDENRAVASRLKLLRKAVGNGSQTSFAREIGVSVARWNNFERGLPLNNEIAILLVRRYPGLTLDWLYLGKEEGLSMQRMREFKKAAEDPAIPEG